MQGTLTVPRPTAYKWARFSLKDDQDLLSQTNQQGLLHSYPHSDKHSQLPMCLWLIYYNLPEFATEPYVHYISGFLLLIY
jgi:hypothetical protein